MKKAILVLIALVRLILAILAAVIVFMIISRFTNLSQQGMDSYQELFNDINVNDDTTASSFANGQRIAMNLYMDDRTAIIGFPKNRDFFTVTNSEDANSQPLIKMEKQNCAEGKACLCICRIGFEFIRAPPEFKCKTMICNELNENLDFAVNVPVEVKESFMTYKLYRNGFLIYRDNAYPTNLGLIQWNSRSNAIYMEKIANKIAVCDKTPCFPV